MDYTKWREDVFGQEPGSDPVLIDLPQETDEFSSAETLDHIGRALDDEETHSRFSRPQIGIGLHMIYSLSGPSLGRGYIDDSVSE